MKELIPILVASISAITVLIGYLLQKHKEQMIEINKTRQELYTRLIKNLSKKLELFEMLKHDPDVPDLVTKDDVERMQSLIRSKYPDLEKAINESIEIGALMSLYASDKAIKACAEFYRASWASMQPGSSIRPDKNHLLHSLRKSLFRGTKVTKEDIEFITSK